MSRQFLISLAAALASACESAAQEQPVPTAGRMERLIQGLDSDNYAVREAASQELNELGESAVPVVEAALNHNSEEVRFRAAVILKRLKVGPLLKLRKELAEYARSGPELDVEQGMYLLALILDEKVKKADLNRQLDEIAAKVRERLEKDAPLKGASAANADPEKAVAALRQVLFTDLGFGPNEEDYGNANNCSLAKILDTKKGRPVFMCHLMIAVARRLDIPLVGLPVSGKYIVKYDGARAPAGFPKVDIYIHAYDKGRILNREDRLREYPSHNPDSMVPADTSRGILDRMLNNLVTTLSGRDQPGDDTRRQLLSEFGNLLEQSMR